MSKQKSFIPDIITNQPDADIPINGLVSKLIQANDQQFIFMEFENDIEVPVHSHNAQWGGVLDGEMELTVNRETRLLKKGDTYFIDKDIPHSAKIKKGYKDLTFFDQKDRYKIKE